MPGQRGIFFDRYAGTDREYYSCFSVMLALCLHKHKNEHIAPIMFPPFSLDPIGFSVVGPMGTFFAPFHFTFLRARFASVFAKASTRQAAQSPPLRGGSPVSHFSFWWTASFLVSSLSLQLQIGNANCPMKVQCSMYYLTI